MCGLYKKDNANWMQMQAQSAYLSCFLLAFGLVAQGESCALGCLACNRSIAAKARDLNKLGEQLSTMVHRDVDLSWQGFLENHTLKVKLSLLQAENDRLSKLLEDATRHRKKARTVMAEDKQDHWGRSWAELEGTLSSVFTCQQPIRNHTSSVSRGLTQFFARDPWTRHLLTDIVNASPGVSHTIEQQLVRRQKGFFTYEFSLALRLKARAGRRRYRKIFHQFEEVLTHPQDLAASLAVRLLLYIIL